MDKNWKFAYGHTYARQDYFHATRYFSYITRSGNGDGTARIIGVGNGDPGSHEKDVFFTETEQLLLNNGKITVVEETDKKPLEADFDDSSWSVHVKNREQMIFPREKTVMVRVEFYLIEFTEKTAFTLFAKSLALVQSIYLDGKLIAENINRDTAEQVFTLDNKIIKAREKCIGL